MWSLTDYQQLYILTILHDENRQHKASNVFQKIFELIMRTVGIFDASSESKDHATHYQGGQIFAIYPIPILNKDINLKKF